MRRNGGGGHGGAISEEEAWSRHLGSIWGRSGKHLGWLWESFENDLGVIYTPRRHPVGPRPPRRLQEVLDSKSDSPLSENAKVLSKY